MSRSRCGVIVVLLLILPFGYSWLHYSIYLVWRTLQFPSFRAAFLRCRKRRFLDAADFAWIEFRERKALAAEVFQRRADEIELLVVDDEESVVERFVCR